MTVSDVQSHTVVSCDGTTIGYLSLGDGPGVILVGGALRSGSDYLPLARCLSQAFTVHLVDRRGRGGSGPQGDDYSMQKEVEDLAAVQVHTGATLIFGHSYGGLIALEAARVNPALTDIAVYEPAISIGRSIPTAWLPRYSQYLAAGRGRKAFASMIKAQGFAPRALTAMPLWYVQAVMRLVIRGPRWAAMAALLQSNLREHQQLEMITGAPERYATISARVLLLAGDRSPAYASRDVQAALVAVLPQCTAISQPGLGHLAPDEQDPTAVSQEIVRFFAHHLQR